MIQNIAPSCKCSACILTPESSHGLLMVGMFQPAHVATMHGRSPLSVPAKVVFSWQNGLRGLHVTPAV